jgi:hypothetical protein
VVWIGAAEKDLSLSARTWSMAYLLHIGFDNTRRLARKAYLMEYEGHRFKSVQGDLRKNARHHLLTVLPSGSEDQKQAAFQAGATLLSALARELGATVAVWPMGGRSWHAGCRYLPQRQRRPRFRESRLEKLPETKAGSFTRLSCKQFIHFSQALR